MFVQCHIWPFVQCSSLLGILPQKHFCGQSQSSTPRTISLCTVKSIQISSSASPSSFLHYSISSSPLFLSTDFFTSETDVEDLGIGKSPQGVATFTFISHLMSPCSTSLVNTKGVEDHRMEKWLTLCFDIMFDDGQPLIPSVPTCFSTSIIQEVTGHPSMHLSGTVKAISPHTIPLTLPLYHNTTQLWASIPISCAWLCPWYWGNIASI